jgi:hypothetical protein
MRFAFPHLPIEFEIPEPPVRRVVRLRWVQIGVCTPDDRWSPTGVLAQPARSRYVPVINQERLVMAGAVGTGSRPGKVNQPVETSTLDLILRRLERRAAPEPRPFGRMDGSTHGQGP